jgi:hypothetical protein
MLLRDVVSHLQLDIRHKSLIHIRSAS